MPEVVMRADERTKRLPVVMLTSSKQEKDVVSSYDLGANSKRDLLAFPEAVKDDLGTALSVAQFGGKHPNAKPWKGEGVGIFEVVDDHRGDTYRAVYAVKFEDAVYVLHAFQKKSPSGTRTAQTDVRVIRQRLKLAKLDYEARYGEAKK